MSASADRSSRSKIRPVIRPAGDMGLLVEFGAAYDPLTNRAVLAFDRALAADLPEGVIETVPTFRSVLVRFDPLELPPATLERHLEKLLRTTDWSDVPATASGRLWRLPVVYGGAHGPDLAALAERLGTTPSALIEAHQGTELTVAMLGFSPGLAYLGQLPELFDIPRRTAITPEVPAGAILVAVRQTVLPATPIPTGWWQIGRTPFLSFEPDSPEPFHLKPGDRVRFEPVTPAAFDSFDQAAFLAEQGA